MLLQIWNSYKAKIKRALVKKIWDSEVYLAHKTQSVCMSMLCVDSKVLLDIYLSSCLPTSSECSEFFLILTKCPTFQYQTLLEGGGSRGEVVMGWDLQSEGRGFESQYHFSH